ncbi:hypothetical protein ACLOJK_014830 [Asimina triloba]
MAAGCYHCSLARRILRGTLKLIETLPTAADDSGDEDGALVHGWQRCGHGNAGSDCVPAVGLLLSSGSFGATGGIIKNGECIASTHATIKSGLDLPVMSSLESSSPAAMATGLKRMMEHHTGALTMY